MYSLAFVPIDPFFPVLPAHLREFDAMIDSFETDHVYQNDEPMKNPGIDSTFVHFSLFFIFTVTYHHHTVTS